MAQHSSQGPDQRSLVNGHPPAIRSRADFIALARTLVRDLRDKPSAWENNSLPAFLDALAAWTEDMDGYYRNQGHPVPEGPTWQLFAEMLLAARVYE